MSLVGALLLALVVGAFAAAMTALLTRRRGPDAAVSAVEGLAMGIGRLQDDLGRLGRTQDNLRQEVQQGRETSLLRLADVAQGLRGELGLATVPSEVKALEQADRDRWRGRGQPAPAGGGVAGSSPGVPRERTSWPRLARFLVTLLGSTDFGNLWSIRPAPRGSRPLPIDRSGEAWRGWTVSSGWRRRKLRRAAPRSGRAESAAVSGMSKYLDAERSWGSASWPCPTPSLHPARGPGEGTARRIGGAVVPGHDVSLAL